MATFKVGQRVKLILPEWGEMVYGDQGVIFGPDIYYDYVVIYDRNPGNPHYNNAAHLAPLTDPKADEFIARMRNPMPLRAVRYVEPPLPVKERA